VRTERQWIAQRVDDHVDFCRKAAARAADGLVATPLRAPALCWCALTMVASIIAYSLSGSSAKVLKKTLPNPAHGPTRKALVGVLPVAEPLRQMRDGAPERNFQNTASTNKRLPSSLLRPTVPGRPGRSVSIRAIAQSIALHRKAP
jgi:hypothetical protein